MAHKQTVADRLMGDTSRMTRMAGMEARDADLCPRCDGLMVDERYYDFCGNQPFQGVRCINCGEMLDPLIRVHRAQMSGSTHLPTKNRSDFQTTK